jgi:hypothetical protein
MGGARVCRFIHADKCFFEDLNNGGANGNLDVVSCLLDVNAVVHVKVSLPFGWYFKFVVDEVRKDVCCFLHREQ